MEFAYPAWPCWSKAAEQPGRGCHLVTQGPRPGTAVGHADRAELECPQLPPTHEHLDN